MKKLLIADDEKYMRLLVRTTLESSEYALSEAENGQQTLDLVRAEQPDLVLLDVMMPAPDGIAVCRAIRSDPDLAAMKVVMLTARGQAEERDAGLAAGADAYLTKPFSPLELLALIEELLRPTVMGGSEQER